eukprot:10783179-Heterocapsa_arctica.AAC.1
MVGLHVTSRQAAPSQAMQRRKDLRKVLTLEGRMFETKKRSGSWEAAKMLSSSWAEACARWSTAMNGPGLIKPNTGQAAFASGSRGPTR